MAGDTLNPLLSPSSFLILSRNASDSYPSWDLELFKNCQSTGIPTTMHILQKPAYNFRGVPNHTHPHPEAVDPILGIWGSEALFEGRCSGAYPLWEYHAECSSSPSSFSLPPAGKVSAKSACPDELASWTSQQWFPGSRGNSQIPLSKSCLCYWFSPLEALRISD